MKLACFYPGSLYCARSVSIGLVDTLERMGHEVRAVPIAGTENSIRREGHAAAQLNQSAYPTSAQLRECEGILLSGPEHMQLELAALYPAVERH